MQQKQNLKSDIIAGGDVTCDKSIDSMSQQRRKMIEDDLLAASFLVGGGVFGLRESFFVCFPVLILGTVWLYLRVRELILNANPGLDVT